MQGRIIRPQPRISAGTRNLHLEDIPQYCAALLLLGTQTVIEQGIGYGYLVAEEVPQGKVRCQIQYNSAPVQNLGGSPIANGANTMFK